MDLFLKAAAAVLLAVILYLVVNNRSKELAILLTLAVCSMIVLAAGRFLHPVLAFAKNLQSVGGMNDEYLSILLKVVGIGFLAEITSLVCADAGNATLGKVLQILASCVILWLSLPLLNGLIELVHDILGEI